MGNSIKLDPTYETLHSRWQEICKSKSEFANELTKLSDETDGILKHNLLQIATWFNQDASFDELLERPEILAACVTALKSEQKLIEPKLVEQSARNGFFQIVSNAFSRPQIMKLLKFRLALLLTIGVLLTIFSVSLAPAFQEIYDDFGIELNSVTTLVFTASDLIRATWWLLPILVVGFLVGNFIWCCSTAGKQSLSNNWIDHEFKNTRGELGNWCWHTAMLLELGWAPKNAYLLAGKSITKNWISNWSARLAQTPLIDATPQEGDWLLNDRYDLINQAILTPSHQSKIALLKEISNYYWSRSQTTSQWWIQLIFNMLFWLIGLLALIAVLALALPLISLIGMMTGGF
ncbi:hypothetical protein N9B60_05525 [Mariniblastus sp.]|nr:hypothetical protein [bacterium]MDA7924843.1 hypothetical protein [Mariniblastus sp.]MDB4357554.1 hypothetical protein [Mariniblastus sp.]MDB4458464.1 hypothetical protein [bacterium]